VAARLPENSQGDLMTDKVFLKPNVLFEPLVNQWYAWPFLIAPGTAAMFIANLHLKIMQSFINAPQVHISALKNPAMLGGPFINYDASKVAAIKALLDKTTTEQRHMLQFAEAVKQLDEMLTNEANGYSLTALYEKAPEALKGYVELVYDANNHPSIRFIEGLLYKSQFYNSASQSVALSLIDNDNRQFILSTPLLEDESRLHLRVPFDDERLDELFKMKHVPQPYEYIRDLFKITAGQDELFSSFFTTTTNGHRTPDYDGDGVRIRYFGHACLLIESKEINILCDPVIGYEFESDINRYTYDDLPERIDYLVITHAHQDHCIFETLLQLRHQIKNIIVPRSSGGELIDPSMKLVLRSIGFKNVVEIGEMEMIDVEGGTITGIPFLGEHADLNVKTKIAYLVTLGGKSIMCAADSNNIEPKLYEHVREVVGDVDALFLGMECDGAPLTWLYGPLLTKPLARKMDQSRRFDGSDAIKGLKIVELLNARHAYVYAMGQEPWLTFLTSIQYTKQSRPIVESDKLVEECRRRGIESKRLFGCEAIILDSIEMWEPAALQDKVAGAAGIVVGRA
jgi:L-ascorbate metabolism protein UlaG (beta-lactamase superfamily)